MDEFTIFKGHRYATVIADAKTRQVIWIRLGRSRKDIRPFLEQLGKHGNNIGAGAKYLGIGGSGQYRMDQVTVNLRAVDVRTGQVLLSVTTTKTISSHEIGFGAFRFVDYKELLEVEMGYSQNEPVNIAGMSAIDAAVIHLIVKGMKRGMWSPSDPNALENPIIARYSEASTDIL